VVARVGGSNTALLASDKAGEVWALDSPRLSGRLRLMGHTASIITDMCVVEGGEEGGPGASPLLVTADRDEKIRASRFPQVCRLLDAGG